MGKTLQEIAQELCTEKNGPGKKNGTEETKPIPKVQLIYGFNGSGKTRLSREFKAVVAPKAQTDLFKVLYYNAFTEDLFYWDNDLEGDAEPKLQIRPISFTNLVLKELKDQGLENDVIGTFQRFVNTRLTPSFSSDYSEVTFSYQRGNDEPQPNIKISKGEESNFVWSVFYSLLKLVVSVLNVPELSDRETQQFNDLKYVFIDDPVSSLDENHLIQLAVNLGQLIRSSNSDLKFIITTHNPLFYNVLYNELGNKTCYLLESLDNGTYALIEKEGDSNKSFSYHLHIKNLIQQAVDQKGVQRYHFALLRNLYEKTCNFLGYAKWSDLLPDDQQAYASRVMNFYPHNTLSIEEVAEPTQPEKEMVGLLLAHLNTYGYWQSK